MPSSKAVSHGETKDIYVIYVHCVAQDVHKWCTNNMTLKIFAHQSKLLTQNHIPNKIKQGRRQTWCLKRGTDKTPSGGLASVFGWERSCNASNQSNKKFSNQKW